MCFVSVQRHRYPTQGNVTRGFARRVIPAKAGIHTASNHALWVPASAGTTPTDCFELSRTVVRAGGNPDSTIPFLLSGPPRTRGWRARGSRFTQLTPIAAPVKMRPLHHGDRKSTRLNS